MNFRTTAILCLICMIFSLCSCANEPEALSGVAPSSVDVTPTPIASEGEFMYDSQLSLADSFNQMNTRSEVKSFSQHLMLWKWSRA